MIFQWRLTDTLSASQPHYLLKLLSVAPTWSPKLSVEPTARLFVMAHRTAAQNCSVTAVVSSVTFQPFVSAFSLANLCSI